jgi:hypothetical protein
MPEFYQHAIVACARRETDALPEWLAYHRKIGFDHVYLYCNDDDPTECYERLLPSTAGPSPFVSFIYFPFIGLQGEMYKHFLRHRVREVGWFIFLDVDEFLVFRQDGSVGDFIAKRQDYADMIFLNALVFGHAGLRQRPSGSVLLNHTRRGRELQHQTKVLTRARPLDVARYVGTGEPRFWHDWNFRGERLKRATNVIDDDMSGYFATPYESGRAYLDHGDRAQRIIETAIIHHYQFQSEDDIARRLRRGTSGDFRDQLALQRVVDAGKVAEFLSEFSEVEDTCLADYWRYVRDSARLTAIIARPASANIALGRPALQSSISTWSHGATAAEDAGRAVGGTFSGSYNAHTGEEDSPWWQVDLLTDHTIRQIQIFNRIDAESFRKRTLLFALETSLDGLTWTTLYQTAAPMAFGGVDGEPLIWTSEKGMLARYFRIRLLTRGLLAIDAVEIYETPVETIDLDPARYGKLTESIVRSTRRRG